MNETKKLSNRLPICTGRNIRKYRHMRELSMKQLADVVGISPSFISCLENNKRSGANYTIIRDIANALGCSIQNLMEEEFDEVLTAEDRRNSLLELLEKILKAENALDDKTIRKLEVILKIKTNLLE